MLCANTVRQHLRARSISTAAGHKCGLKSAVRLLRKWVLRQVWQTCLHGSGRAVVCLCCLSGGLGELAYPLVSDLKREISEAYGVLSGTVRVAAGGQQQGQQRYGSVSTHPHGQQTVWESRREEEERTHRELMKEQTWKTR